MIEPTPVTVLDTDDCWELLRTHPVGRLATSVDDQPEIFPVNYVVDGDSVIFRTAQGWKLLELVTNDHVAFEADDWSEGVSGWSVVVTGRAERVETSDDIDHCESLGLQPWVGTPKTVYVRIRVAAISGRRFEFGTRRQA